MRRWNLSHYAISSCATAALLAGCGGAQPPIDAPGASSQTSRAEKVTRLFPTTSSYQVLHRFGRHVNASHDHGGANPDAGLVDVNGTLYGTTNAGGHGNNGVVYSISTTGAKKVCTGFAVKTRPTGRAQAVT
jgi:uncharacterized repeat protein (TIGR03803 family)